MNDDQQKPFHIPVDVPPTTADNVSAQNNQVSQKPTPQQPLATPPKTEPDPQLKTTATTLTTPTPTQQAAPQPTATPLQQPLRQTQWEPIRPPTMEQPQTQRTMRTPSPPTPAQIIIRTMDSDIKSVAKSSQTATPASSPQPVAEAKESTITPSQQNRKSRSGILIGILALLLIIGGLGFFGYDAITPFLTKKTTLPVPKESATPEPKPTPRPTFTHTSFFRKPADKTASATFSAITLENIRATLASFSKETPNTLQEVVLNLDNQPIPLSSFGDFFFVGFPYESFSEDYTLGLYYDETGTWPFLIMRLKGETQNIVLLKEKIQQIIEQDSQFTVTQLYIKDPGTPTPSFLDGGVGNITKEVRYRRFEGPNSLNYAWFNDNLIVATSYATLKEVINRLQ